MTRFSRKPGQTARARRLRREASATEYRVWLLLSRSQMGVTFRRQHPVGPYFLDYYCPELKLAVEIDGDLHDVARDARRDVFLSGKGIRVLRIPASHVDDSLDAVGEAIRQVVDEMQALKRAG
ncbi:MAG TPA: endonuclease domain-containing protein [Hyphomonas sp.]|nr:endonuclease domain-containing protein [Hyphomonas sp.]